MVRLPYKDGVFKTIVIDPPWPEKGGGRIKRGADKHYPLMSIKEIVALGEEIQRVANANCHLYLWCTNNYSSAAEDIIKAWGFRKVSIITWVKGYIRDGRLVLQTGLGQYYRGVSEHCYFALRGKLPYKTINGKRAQGLTAFLAPRTEHSVKPEELYRMAETVSYPPRLEMFARKEREGWYVWGDQV